MGLHWGLVIHSFDNMLHTMPIRADFLRKPLSNNKIVVNRNIKWKAFQTCGNGNNAVEIYKTRANKLCFTMTYERGGNDLQNN